MSEWEPAMDAEVAMRDALRTDDQESYFRILAGVDLLLPVSADALAGLAPLGWGTWSTGGRTHVLAFTSPSALQACLADYTGSARRVAYAELADTWPNLEWWLAVNPGLPIEGYLPAWFVAQLSRGDLRLPTRGPAREGGQPGKKIQDLQAAALAANAAASGPAAYQASGEQGQAAAAAAGPGAGQSSYAAQPASYAPNAPYGGAQASAEQAPRPVSSVPAPSGGFTQQPAPGSGFTQQPAPGGGFAQQQASSGGLPQQSAPDGGYAQQPASSGGFAQQPAPGGGLPQRPAPGGGYAQQPASSGGFAQQPAPGGGFPQQPVSSAPTSGTGFGQRPSSAEPAQGGGFGQPRSDSTADAPPSARPDQGPPPGGYGFAQGPGPGQLGPGGLPIRTPGAVLPSGLPSRIPAGSQPSSDASSPAAPTSYQPPAPPPGATGDGPPSRLGGAAAFGAPPARPGAAPGGPAGSLRPPGAAAAFGSRGETGRPDLPTRSPLAQTPPVAPEQSAVQPASAPPQMPGALGGALPRRQVTPPSERPPSMAAAAQALAGTRTPQAEPPTAQPQAPAGGEPPRPGLAPPVIPGAGGSDRSSTPFVPAPSLRPTVPAEQPVPSPRSPEPGEEEFVPANAVEQDLYEAAGGRSTDAFLSTLLLATVLVPVAANSRPGSSPGESGFAFRTEELDGERYLVVFTSRDRLGEHFAEPTRTVGVRFVELIRNWPDPAWSFAVNPNSPVGAKYPGPQVIALASWATESGLGLDPADGPAVVEPVAVPAPQRATDSAQHATVMQKTVPAGQVDYFLDRGYDRVAGFVHRASEVEHLRTPGELFGALGLTYEGSPYQADAKEAFVLRWPAYRPSLYRIPYGGQSEQALRAMDGWVIERPPFRGNGFAPGEGRDVVAEFKVDSVRLPHGAQLWRMDNDGAETMIAVFDGDVPVWRRVGE